VSEDEKKSLDLKGLFQDVQNEFASSHGLHRSHSVHKGKTGEASETLWINLLREYLPNRYKIETGFVVDSKGCVSDQIDIIIFDYQYTPFVLHRDNQVIVPAEGVYAVFEVKQEISKEHLVYASEKASSVRGLHRTSAQIRHAGGVYAPREPIHILAGLLTLSSSWTPPLGDSFAEHFLDCASTEAGSLDLGCTLEGGGYRLVDGAPKSIAKSASENSLMYFLLSLFHQLQQVGTVTAIDMLAYMKSLE
jgi:hypothetical protein